jgi:hypothetical protein
MPSESDILKLVESQPGLNGREIAARLHSDKSAINSILWKLKNRGLTRQNNAYRWFAVERASVQSTEQASPRELTKLGRLCRYYLECLSLDDEAGVRVFARSQFALDYVELPEIPGLITDQSVTAFPGVDDLFRRLRNDRERKVPYIGYPVRLKHMKSPKWEGFMLEPVFMFGFNDDALRPGGTAALNEETPTINFAVVKSLAIGNDAFAMRKPPSWPRNLVSENLTCPTSTK